MKRLLVLVLSLLAAPAAAQTLGVSVAPPTPANTILNITTAPTAPNSTSAFRMQGLSGTITPVMTGNVLVTVSGYLCATTTNCQASGTGTAATTGMQFQISLGTGAAPGNNTTIAGTQYGTVQAHENGVTMTAADIGIPFSTTALVTGLSVGTTYWIDLAAESIGVISGQGISQCTIVATELP